MKRELTQEQREHLEALIRTTNRMIQEMEMNLERLKGEKKAHERFLRDYGQPVLIPPEGGDVKANATLQEISDSCAKSEEDTLHMLMRQTRIECMGMWIEVK